MDDGEIPKTKSDKIRELGRNGIPVADIARKLGIRYQHARKVLLEAGLLPGSTRTVNLVRIAKSPKVKKVKPALHINELLLAGFELISKNGNLAQMVRYSLKSCFRIKSVSMPSQKIRR